MNQHRILRRTKTLPAKYYLSSEVFEAERRRIFDRQWLCVGRADEIAEAGQYKRLELEGESLILVRGDDDRFRCHYNVCRHRGARLCEHDEGTFAAETIACPYHGWTYALDGRLRTAPHMQNPQSFRPEECGLKGLATIVRGGFVLVNFDVDAQLDAATESFFERLEKRWSAGELVSRERREYRVQANWKLLLQNYNECYHCPGVHPALNQLSSFRTAKDDLHEGPVLGGPMTLADGVMSMTTTGDRCGTYLPRLSEADRRHVYYYSVFPSLLLSPHPDFLLVHRLQRVAIDETLVICELLFHPSAIEDPAFDPTPALQFWDETNRQDWHVCELSQQGVASRAYEPGPYSQLESTVAAFDSHYLSVLEGDGEVGPSS